MEITIPKTSTVFGALIRADLTVQWRNRRALVLALLVPFIIVFTWKPMIARVGGPFVLSTAITIGLIAISLMGYANSIARDRDKGIFQRLRVAPVPNWCIMVSRITVQLIMILLMTVLVFIAGYKFDNISLSISGYALTIITALAGAALYLFLGQLIVARMKNPETVNATTRFVYLGFIMLGMFGELGAMGEIGRQIVEWSPFGTVKTIIATGMQPDKWDINATYKLLVTFGYTILVGIPGITWFKWNTK